jgi:type IV secretory pathway VirB10-like protein
VKKKIYTDYTHPDDEFLLNWEDGAEGIEDSDMPYYLGGGGGGGQPPPPPPPPPGQGELELRYQADRDREEAHQQAKKLAAQNKTAQQKAESKRIKKREAEEKKAKSVARRGTEDGGEASGWVPVAMRDDRGRLVYDQSGRVKYHPQNGPRDGPTKKNK